MRDPLEDVGGALEHLICRPALINGVPAPQPYPTPHPSTPHLFVSQIFTLILHLYVIFTLILHLYVNPPQESVFCTLLLDLSLKQSKPKRIC